MKTLRWLSVLVLIGCASGPKPTTTPTGGTPPEGQPLAASTCDEHQTTISHEADTRAAPWSVAQHLAKNFPDGQVSWLMKDISYQNFVVKPAAKDWGRCDDTGCYAFVAPAATIHAAVAQSMHDGHHDPAALGKALGLPATNFEGPLRMMTFDTHKVGACLRLPVDTDPGVWKCKTPEDTDCFKFGGYTSGGVPELMVINAAVDKTTIEEVP
jgi:hypothetical protein